MPYQLALGVASAIVNLPSNNSSIWIVLKIVENFRRKRYDVSHQLSRLSWSRLGVLAHRRDTKYNRNSRGSSFYVVAEVLRGHGSLRVFTRSQKILGLSPCRFSLCFFTHKVPQPNARESPRRPMKAGDAGGGAAAKNAHWPGSVS